MNKLKYGLAAADFKHLKLPKSHVAGNRGISGGVVLTIEQIFNLKSHFSCVEKIQHLERLQGALDSKLESLMRRKQQTQIKKMYRSLN